MKLFIANRGEIAVRIARTAREMGIETVLGVSEPDAESLAARSADHYVVVGPAQAAASYLNQDALIAAALEQGCDAVHPGYGFLSENADFARRWQAPA
jgi:acetyl-CoA carboxylase biotin carboxylase subunit